MKDYNKITLCYICNQEVGATPLNTNGVSVCPDCVKRIVKKYISDLIQEQDGLHNGY